VVIYLLLRLKAAHNMYGQKKHQKLKSKIHQKLETNICLERGADCLHIVELMPLHPKTPSSLALVKSRLVLPLWQRLTQLVLEKRSLNGCSSSNFLIIYSTGDSHSHLFYSE